MSLFVHAVMLCYRLCYIVSIFLIRVVLRCILVYQVRLYNEKCTQGVCESCVLHSLRLVVLRRRLLRLTYISGLAFPLLQGVS